MFMALNLAVYVLLLAVTGVRAENATPFQRDGMAAMRLVDAGRRDDGTRLALIEIMLEGDAKTYWRHAGDSGIAPDFDFSASENIAKAEVLFPVPVRFSDGGGQSIGYHGRVALPVFVTVRDSARPVRLALTLNYAVCQKLCMPARGEAMLEMSEPAPTPDFAAAFAKVPVPMPESAMARPVDGKAVDIELRVPQDEQHIDLFAEGPDAGWTLPLPVLLRRDGDLALFRLDLDGAPSGQSFAGKTLRLTLVTGERGQEFTLPLSR